mmetsp:Transcript_22526/g.49308  ORF Transcript_22526/g.49308 Transcript_22526/m.49308 type:complete len:262 (+) Transcript_22526:1478-2263(+)
MQESQLSSERVRGRPEILQQLIVLGHLLFSEGTVHLDPLQAPRGHRHQPPKLLRHLIHRRGIHHVHDGVSGVVLRQIARGIHHVFAGEVGPLQVVVDIDPQVHRWGQAHGYLLDSGPGVPLVQRSLSHPLDTAPVLKVVRQHRGLLPRRNLPDKPARDRDIFETVDRSGIRHWVDVRNVARRVGVRGARVIILLLGGCGPGVVLLLGDPPFLRAPVNIPHVLIRLVVNHLQLVLPQPLALRGLHQLPQPRRHVECAQGLEF